MEIERKGEVLEKVGAEAEDELRGEERRRARADAGRYGRTS
jgi:hypothetical protein